MNRIVYSDTLDRFAVITAWGTPLIEPNDHWALQARKKTTKYRLEYPLPRDVLRGEEEKKKKQKTKQKNKHICTLSTCIHEDWSDDYHCADGCYTTRIKGVKVKMCYEHWDCVIMYYDIITCKHPYCTWGSFTSDEPTTHSHWCSKHYEQIEFPEKTDKKMENFEQLLFKPK